jgi:alkylation response protein AidB-like acyl-CoA dehydrogenase
MSAPVITSAPFLELNLTISDEARDWQLKARDFAREVVLPTGVKLDRMDAQDAVGDSSPIWSFLELAHREGFTKTGGPKELGGLGLTRLEEYLIFEEIATGDAGLGAVLFLAPFPYQYSYNFEAQRLIDDISRPYFSGDQPTWHGCWAITEMEHGSDYLGAHTTELTVAGGAVRAQLDGDEWVISGRKSMWVSSAMTATHATLFLNIEEEGLHRGGIAIVPLDLPGVSRMPALDKHGLRALNQGQLVFDDVRIPREYMIVEPDTFVEVLHATHALANVSTALLAFGTGRAAYEGALKWTKERVQGGKPIHEHQGVRTRLFRMFSLLEASRALIRAVYLHNYGKADAGEEGSIQHSCASKVIGTEGCFEVCDIAFQLTGDRGTARDGVEFADGSRFYPEKLLRDAKSYKIADGENAFLALIGAANLENMGNGSVG